MPARTSSSRLPGKVIRTLLGRPMIEHQIERIRQADLVDQIVIATTQQPQDKELLAIAERMGVAAYAGSEDDVLDRIYQAALAQNADLVLRLTGDGPLLDPCVVDRFVSYFLDHLDSVDYVGVGASYPDGQDVEVFSFGALHRTWQEAEKEYEREHVSVYTWQSGKFLTVRLEHEPDLSEMRWEVNEEEDFQFVEAVYEALFPEYGYKFGIQDILDLLKERPDLQDMNSTIRRNEGFLTSLREQRVKKVKLRNGSITQSEEYWRRAQGLIPAGTQTLSKGPTQYVDGVAPKYLLRGRGSHVWDVDGNEYIDYPMGLGAILLGHNYGPVSDAIHRQVDQGIAFSLMHPLEVEVSELLRDRIPCAEMIRFGKNGSDVTTGAVRAARAFTGRDLIAHCGYHGWHDWYIGSTTRNQGVPKWAIDQQYAFCYNDLDSLREIFVQHPERIAAVIMEPYGVTLPEDGFLQGVKGLARENGAILIFDEVGTGFRFHNGGIHQYFGIEPDLACFGKAMGNGMPISALVGRTEIMRVLEEAFYSFTAGGECLSLAAAKATLQEIEEKNAIPLLWETGEMLKTGFNRLAMDYGMLQYVECVGLSPRTFVAFSDIGCTSALLVKSLFQQEVLKRGVLSLSAAHCISLSHTKEDIEYTLGVYQEAFEVLEKAVREEAIIRQIEGRPIQPVFRPVS